MIEVERTITIRNDGAEWTLTELQAMELADKLIGKSSRGLDIDGATRRIYPPTFFEANAQANGAPVP